MGGLTAFIHIHNIHIHRGEAHLLEFAQQLQLPLARLVQEIEAFCCCSCSKGKGKGEGTPEGVEEQGEAAAF